MSELIDRKAAIRATWQEPSYTDPLNVLTEVRDRINALPTIPAPRWHRVEEELPEETKVVIIHKEWDDEITLGYSYSFGEIRMWMCLKTPYDIYEVPWVGAGHVDYWMPLPEPPKEEE